MDVIGNLFLIKTICMAFYDNVAKFERNPKNFETDHDFKQLQIKVKLRSNQCYQLSAVRRTVRH
jgi:fumarate reductase subunit D